MRRLFLLTRRLVGAVAGFVNDADSESPSIHSPVGEASEGRREGRGFELRTVCRGAAAEV